MIFLSEPEVVEPHCFLVVLQIPEMEPLHQQSPCPRVVLASAGSGALQRRCLQYFRRTLGRQTERQSRNIETRGETAPSRCFETRPAGSVAKRAAKAVTIDRRVPMAYRAPTFLDGGWLR